MKKAPHDRLKDILLITWMRTPTHSGRFAITFRKKKHTSEQETQNGFVVASFEEDIEKCSTLALNTSSLAAFAEKITAIEGI